MVLSIFDGILFVIPKSINNGFPIILGSVGFVFLKYVVELAFIIKLPPWKSACEYPVFNASSNNKNIIISLYNL